MVRPLRELHGYQLEATDGLVGHVTDVYFDDDQWSVRYLVVNTGSWFDAREVLISPKALGAADGETRTIAARLTRKQIELSPSVDFNRTVGAPYGAMTYGAGKELARPYEAGDPHLRSSREVIGYHLRATDDTLGHVEDVVIDDETWTIRYLAVDTSNWWFGGHVLISPRWIRAVRWPERLVELAVTRDVIKHSPTWKPTFPITQAYEDSLHDYYRLRQAWSVDRRSNEAPLEPRRE